MLFITHCGDGFLYPAFSVLFMHGCHNMDVKQHQSYIVFICGVGLDKRDKPDSLQPNLALISSNTLFVNFQESKKSNMSRYMFLVRTVWTIKSVIVGTVY